MPPPPLLSLPPNSSSSSSHSIDRLWITRASRLARAGNQTRLVFRSENRSCYPAQPITSPLKADFRSLLLAASTRAVFRQDAQCTEFSSLVYRWPRSRSCWVPIWRASLSLLTIQQSSRWVDTTWCPNSIERRHLFASGSASRPVAIHSATART